MLRHPLHQVTGDQGVLVDLGPDGVGGDGPVPQPYHQGAALLPLRSHQFPQHPGHRPGAPPEGVLLPALQAVHGQRHIGARRFAQSLLPPLIQDVHGL